MLVQRSPISTEVLFPRCPFRIQLTDSAASLLHSPSVLFLDEPTIGLDAISKIAVREFITTINKEKGMTVILTTHDMNDIEALAQRILLIGKGSLLYDGTLDTLRSQFALSSSQSIEEIIVQLYKEYQIT